MLLLGVLFSCTQTKKDMSGSEVYQTYCVHCHQENGLGVATRYPPLAGSEWLAGDLPIKIVLHGLQGPITVKGEAYNNVMGPWGDILSNSEVAGVIQHIRSSWGNESVLVREEAVNEEKVLLLRETYPNHRSWNASTLKD
jgi:mono/diheme cytochrome c family protein